MPKQTTIGSLTGHDIDVLEIFWNSETALSATLLKNEKNPRKQELEQCLAQYQ